VHYVEADNIQQYFTCRSIVIGVLHTHMTDPAIHMPNSHLATIKMHTSLFTIGNNQDSTSHCNPPANAVCLPPKYMQQLYMTLHRCARRLPIGRDHALSPCLPTVTVDMAAPHAAVHSCSSLLQPVILLPVIPCASDCSTVPVNQHSLH
jgi:hypothetical protein